MTTQLRLRFVDLSHEIARARAEVTVARERATAQRALVEEYRLRMLIAETPQADDHLHAAALHLARLERETEARAATLAALLAEERRLSARLHGA